MSETESKGLPPIKVKQYVDPVQLRIDLSYSPNDLTGAMMNQASMFAHYGVLAADSARQVDKLKMLLEQAEAAVSRKIRDEHAVVGAKTTEGQITALIARHPRVVQIKKALNEAKQCESVAKTATEAFRHRRDMLVQHGLISREEMKGELSIREKSARELAMEDSKNTLLERRRLRMEGAATEDAS